MEQLQLELAVVQSKVCSRCKTEKLISEYNKRAASRDGLDARCRDCLKEYKAEYRQKYPDRIIDGRKRHYSSNRDGILAKNAEWRKNNQDCIKKYQAEYWINNKESISAYCKEYRELNKDRIRKQRKEYREINKDVIREKTREYRIKNKMYYKVYSKEYRSKNRYTLLSKKKKYYESTRDKWRIYNSEYRKKNKEILSIKKLEYYNKNKSLIQKKAIEYRLINPEKHRQRTREWRKNNPDKVNALSRNYKARKKNAEGRHGANDIKEMLIKQNALCAECSTPLIENGKRIYQVDHIIPLNKGGTNWPDNLQLLCRFCNRQKSDKLPDEWEEYKRTILNKLPAESLL